MLIQFFSFQFNLGCLWPCCVRDPFAFQSLVHLYMVCPHFYLCTCLGEQEVQQRTNPKNHGKTDTCCTCGASFNTPRMISCMLRTSKHIFVSPPFFLSFHLLPMHGHTIKCRRLKLYMQPQLISAKPNLKKPSSSLSRDTYLFQLDQGRHTNGLVDWQPQMFKEYAYLFS